jgi:uracil-DNA glycosylase
MGASFSQRMGSSLMCENSLGRSRLDRLIDDISGCRICVERPVGRPLPHEPRPVLRVSRTARLAVCGQAPGVRVHKSGVPFLDASGDRLRDWMGVSKTEFYDRGRIAIVPMGFCFPGLDDKGGDLPPRCECAATWHRRIFSELQQLELILLVGQYAMRWHLGPEYCASLTATVRCWRSYLERAEGLRYLPLPHPSWRNNAWLAANPWFTRRLVPRLRAEVKALLEKS